MVDISPYLNKTSHRINQWWEGNQEPNDFYPTLRASELGDVCDRKLWFKYNWVKPAERFDGRMMRLFDRGNKEEDRFIKALEGIGVTVYDMQDEVQGLDGKLTGHIDGCALGLPEAPKTPHLLEFKTFNDKTFKELQKKGVKEAKFQHYVQMQIYMHFKNLTRAMYMAINKNDDEIYTERVEYNKVFALAQIARAKRIVDAKSAPVRISDDPNWYECKFCRMWDICHGGKEYEVKRER